MQVFTDKDIRESLKKGTMEAVNEALKFRGIYFGSKKENDKSVWLTFKFTTQVGLNAFRHSMSSMSRSKQVIKDIDALTCSVLF